MAGDNTALPKLSFVNQVEDWTIGARVITSGDDGYLPRGLNIGTVVRGKNGEFRVQLSSDSMPVDWVWVSPYRRFVAPEDTDQDVEGEVTQAP